MRRGCSASPPPPRPAGELHCEIPVIISNHPDLEPIGRMFEVPFHVLPLANKADKPAQVRTQLLFAPSSSSA